MRAPLLLIRIKQDLVLDTCMRPKATMVSVTDMSDSWILTMTLLAGWTSCSSKQTLENVCRLWKQQNQNNVKYPENKSWYSKLASIAWTITLYCNDSD